MLPVAGDKCRYQSEYNSFHMQTSKEGNRSFECFPLIEYITAENVKYPRFFVYNYGKKEQL